VTVLRLSDAPTGADLLIALSDVSKSYRRGAQIVPVLSKLTFDIRRKEFLALMGPSGSGKSTLLNLIAGIDSPDHGSIKVGGEDITLLPEFYNLMPVLSALENVELPLTLTSLGRRDRRDRAQLALNLVGLSDRVKHLPSELSGGQQQRVAIARAIVTDPTMLVADEPTGDLDRQSAEEVLEIMQRLNRDMGKTIVMVTHDRRAAARAKRIMDLEKGDLSYLVEQRLE
jgi:putative ABC transport system ATP-binding protein